MEFFTHPFTLSQTPRGISQKFYFPDSKSILNEKTLEELLNMSYRIKTSDSKNLQGIIAEILANQLFLEHFEKNFSDNLLISGKIISGVENYLINSNHKYFAKLLSENRVVILKKENNIDENKFGFRNIAEIDGLFMVKRKREEKNQKHLIAVESKSGIIKLNAEHILNDIIRPLQDMYQTTVSYFLIGFKDELYSHPRLNLLEPKLEEIYYKLKEENIKFTAVHFPFSKAEYFSFMSKIESKRTGIYPGLVLYDTNLETIKITLKDGRILEGKFELNE